MTEKDPVEHLAHLIEEVSGNAIPAGNLPFLADIAARRAAATERKDVLAYVDALAAGLLGDEWRSLLPLVTIKESYLFRTPQHFDGIRDVLLPRLLVARAATRRLRVWSAGCARGEEPVTLAIVFAEHPALAGWSWRIDATDVDEEALEAGRRGLFGERAVAQVPPGLLGRHFVRRGELYACSRGLLACIDFHPLNLVREPFVAPTEEPYDLILLRNVLIYFRPESQRRVAAGMAASLAGDGFLFVGPSETLWQLSDTLVPLDLEDCFCYRLAPPPAGPATGHRPGRQPPPDGVTRHAPGAGAPSVIPPRAHTHREGEGGLGRRAAVSEELSGAKGPRGASAGGVRGSAQGVRGDHAPVEPGPRRPTSQGSTTRERMAAAAGHLAASRFAEAAGVVAEALRGEPADPVVHAFEGLLHDVSGRSDLAIASYRATLFLDPALFQVRLLLADALRRLGFADRAIHEYQETLQILAGAPRHELDGLPGVPLPTAEQASRRARAALQHR